MQKKKVSLLRDCVAAQIPSGEKVFLTEGMSVTITQALGGTYTLMTEQGYLVQLAPKDADAVGEKVSENNLTSSDEPLEKLIWDQMRTCYDPEIPINIVELGLVYDCQIIPIPEGGHKVLVKMTLTAPGCGMGGPISEDVKSKILAVPGIKETDVQLVWDPPWNMSMMSDAAKLQLGML